MFTLERPRAAVRVRQRKPQGKDYILDPAEDEPIVFIAPGTLLIEFRDGERILDEDGAEINPTGRFFRSVETCYPYHLVVDFPEQSAPVSKDL